jgi:hypothetical protein
LVIRAAAQQQAMIFRENDRTSIAIENDFRR